MLAKAQGEPLTEERLKAYAISLADLPSETLVRALNRALLELKKFPQIAELRELAGAGPGSDGRLGPEEAWALCPKTEEATVVWTVEMAEAFNAGARELLAAGDEIAARMAFRESYIRKVAAARSRGDETRWSVSLGWDRLKRIDGVVRGVEEGRITRAQAFESISPEQHEELRLALPGEGVGPRLVGKVEPRGEVRLPGLHGILQQMRMDGTVPEGCEAKPAYVPPPPEEMARRKQEALKQAEEIKKRREGV